MTSRKEVYTLRVKEHDEEGQKIFKFAWRHFRMPHITFDKDLCRASFRSVEIFIFFRFLFLQLHIVNVHRWRFLLGNPGRSFCPFGNPEGIFWIFSTKSESDVIVTVDVAFRSINFSWNKCQITCYRPEHKRGYNYGGDLYNGLHTVWYVSVS